MSMRRCQVTYPQTYEGSEREFAQEHGLPTASKGTPRILVGRREWLSLLQIGVSAVHAKVDTGARSSSLHAEKVLPFLKNGERWVSFVTHERHGIPVTCEAKIRKRMMVRSSNGLAEERFFIETVARTPGGLRWPLLLSLTDRREMRFPLLLGRQALSGRFVVDTQRTNLLGNAIQLEMD